MLPQSFATEWAVRPRVLEMVDENAHALDARLPEGDTTIVKSTSTMDALTVVPADLTGYAQLRLRLRERRGAPGGRRLPLPGGLPSHHAVLATGDLTRRLA